MGRLALRRRLEASRPKVCGKIVKHAEFDARYQQLLLDLDELVNLLRKYGENQWADWIAKDRIGLTAFETKAIEHLVSVFGGMGSFNDLMLHPCNGHSIKERDVPAMEEHLGDLSDQIWSNAKYLKKTLGNR